MITLAIVAALIGVFVLVYFLPASTATAGVLILLVMALLSGCNTGWHPRTQAVYDACLETDRDEAECRLRATETEAIVRSGGGGGHVWVHSY